MMEVIIGFAELPVGGAFKLRPAVPEGPVYVKLERPLVPASLTGDEKTSRCNAVCVRGPRRGTGIFVADYTGVIPFCGELTFGR